MGASVRIVRAITVLQKNSRSWVHRFALCEPFQYCNKFRGRGCIGSHCASHSSTAEKFEVVGALVRIVPAIPLLQKNSRSWVHRFALCQPFQYCNKFRAHGCIGSQCASHSSTAINFERMGSVAIKKMKFLQSKNLLFSTNFLPIY